MTTVRCPSCDAAVPADASWCSLCFAPVGAAGARAAAATPVTPPTPLQVDALPAPAPMVPVVPSVEHVLAPVPGVDPWVAAAIADVPAAAVPVPAPAVPAPAPIVPVPAPVVFAPPQVAPAPIVPAPVAAVPVAAVPSAAPTAVATVDAPTWPCTACGTRVDFALSTCPECTTPFMGGATPDISLKVPGVGDLVQMSSGVKFGVMAGGAAVLATLLVLLFLVLGHIF